MALNAEQLDAAMCGVAEHAHTSECDTLYFHARCHLTAGTRVHYDKRTHELHIECRQCERPVASVAVA